MPSLPSDSTEKPSLFRQQALNASRAQGFGRIVLIRPPSLLMVSVLSVSLGALLVALFAFGQYTRRTTVLGQLAPAQGVVRVYPVQTGVVLRRLVQEGQTVRAQQVLYVLSSDRVSASGQSLQAQLSQQVRDRQASLRLEIEKTNQFQQDDLTTQRRRMDGLTQDIAQVDSQMSAQSRRVQLAEQAVRRYQALLKQGFASEEQVQQQQADLLDQRGRLQSLQREQQQKQSEWSQAQSDLVALQLRQQTLRAQLERQLSELNQQLTEGESRREIQVVAPEAGEVSNILADVGQSVDASRPMLSILPKNGHLSAHLYVPSHAAGFIQAGQRVQLRYQAYPYQKFGFGLGTVQGISKNVFIPSELVANGVALDAQLLSKNEPLYRIDVRLQAQQVTAYGKNHQLQAGMVVDADILQETRRLYEWVLEPLYTVSGRL